MKTKRELTMRHGATSDIEFTLAIKKENNVTEVFNFHIDIGTIEYKKMKMIIDSFGKYVAESEPHDQ